MDIVWEFHEDPLPPSRVDIARAMRTARRRRRYQTGFAAMGLVVAVSAGVATAPRWQHHLPGFGGGTRVGGGPDRSGTPPLTCDPAAPLPDQAPVTDGTAFDLLRRRVDAGAVAGYRVEHYETSRYQQRLKLVDLTGHSTVEVVLDAAGRPAVFSSPPGQAPRTVDPATGAATDPVGEAPAFWLPDRQGLYQFEVARLGWRWAPDAWVFVAAADTSHFDAAYNDTPKTAAQIDALRAVARQVATALRLDDDQPVTSPFTVPVPNCTRLVRTHLLSSIKSDGAPFTRLTLLFGEDGREPNGRPAGTVEVTADSGATPADKPGSTTFEVDGHPASGEGDTLRVHGVDGFLLELTTPGGEPAVRALFHSIRIVPGAHDGPSAWTDEPLRR
jgi:hypothetical protein